MVVAESGYHRLLKIVEKFPYWGQRLWCQDISNSILCSRCLLSLIDNIPSLVRRLCRRDIDIWGDFGKIPTSRYRLEREYDFDVLTVMFLILEYWEEFDGRLRPIFRKLLQILFAKQRASYATEEKQGLTNITDTSLCISRTPEVYQPWQPHVCWLILTI
jgi:hypothetical protein